MQAVHIGELKTWIGLGFTIKIDEWANQDKYRPVCSDKMRVIINFTGIT